jgi:Na+/H+ antiporter NhaC
MNIFIAAIPLNFYALISVIFAFIVATLDWNFGPMKKAERRAREVGKLYRDGAQLVVDESVISQPIKEGANPRLRNLMLPLFVMLAMVPIGIAITGGRGVNAAKIVEPTLMDYLKEASGSTAVLWAVLAALLVAAISTRLQKIFRTTEIVDLSFKGAGGLISLATLMMFAFAIGMTCNKLGTGVWVAGAIKPYLNPKMIAALVFLTSAFISFSTGTSWGTFAIMMPLAVPLAATFQAEGAAISMPLIVSAVLGGGVFGDHCSPISDTTIVSSMAACSDHIDHVRTQLPYALLAAGLTVVIYLAIGFFA